MNAPAAKELASDQAVPSAPKSKGQKFKELHGYSKSMKRNMQKHKCSTVEEYRKIRKSKKK